MYQNQGRTCKPCLGPLLAGVSKSPKVFQNHQCSDQLIPECFKITKSVSKSPKIPLDLSRDLCTWSVTWSDTWSVLVAECFKITKSVSKSPKLCHVVTRLFITTQFLSALRASPILWIDLLNVLPRRQSTQHRRRGEYLPVLNKATFLHVVDVRSTRREYCMWVLPRCFVGRAVIARPWCQSWFVMSMLLDLTTLDITRIFGVVSYNCLGSTRTNGEWHLITIPYTLAADVSVTNQKYCLEILKFTA